MDLDTGGSGAALGLETHVFLRDAGPTSCAAFPDMI